VKLRIFGVKRKVWRGVKHDLEGHIKELPTYADRILKDSRVGRVHSVYRKTINLALGERLLAFQTTGSPLSPVGLITDLSEEDFETLKVEEGDCVFVDGERIQIRDVIFFMGGAALCELALSKTLSEERQRYLKGQLGKLLVRDGIGVFCWAISGGNYGEPDLLANASVRQLFRTREWMKNENWEAAAKELCLLVGLGIGLTPGGDDFLCGVLAGTVLAGREYHPFSKALRTGIRESLQRTNDISRAFLLCALEGEYGQMIHGFYEEGPEEIFKEARAIGHSSGVDTLCGILYFFELQENWK